MAAGFRSPLYLLGIAAAAGVASGGFVSPLAPWLGGAAAPSVSSGPGFTSPLAPWLGGASAIPSCGTARNQALQTIVAIDCILT